MAIAGAREWLVTNGRGGYASGTVAGTLTRRYHGLLVAALQPPVRRRLIVAKCELDVTYDGVPYALAAKRWADDSVAPQGYRLCESFALRDGLPVWTYACGDVLLEQSIAMVAGADATAVCLRLTRGHGPLTVRARVLVADRDHHGGPLPDPVRFGTECDDGAARVGLPLTQRTLTIFAPGARFTAAAERYAGFMLVREAERGLEARDDYAHVVTGEFTLLPGNDGGLVFTLDALVERNAGAVVASAREANARRANAYADPLLGELAVAADAFIVARGEGPDAGRTVVAGYPWFADWGRDTMIALPGLTLHTARPEVAAGILRTFASTIDGGMLPNHFPDDGAPPEYNTVDGALWYVEAVRAYHVLTGDDGLLRDVFCALDAIVEGYVAGTRFGIVVDADGLVRAGVPGVQLTWMDAKVGDRVITPRIGKPIEINALWYAALRAMEAFALRLERPASRYRDLAERCAAGFGRFWNPARNFCFDVLDGPNGNDAALRPNQLFAVALHAVALDADRARAVVDICARELLTSLGLRTLGPSEAGYIGRYFGDQTERDAAYHQGTVWPWLIGPFVRAHLRVYGDPAGARSFVRPLVDALEGDALGTLGEIFDGDPPHAPRGTFAQAWSVAELMATLRLLDDAPRAPATG
ncbi:MAG: amylo-alpha-1,6-glucosidase [Candidatus Velthaea sp.]